MKLYTRPRPIPAICLRPGDQLALADGGRLIRTEADYIDLDLRAKVRWTTVRAIDNAGALLTIDYPEGSADSPPGSPVIIREAIELDPWTYVERVSQKPDPRDQLPTREVRRPQ